MLLFCFQSFPALGSFLMSQFFTSGGQSIGASALASVLPMNIQGWFPLGLTGLISLQSKGLSRVFSRFKINSRLMQEVTAKQPPGSKRAGPHLQSLSHHPALCAVSLPPLSSALAFPEQSHRAWCPLTRCNRTGLWVLTSVLTELEVIRLSP